MSNENTDNLIAGIKAVIGFIGKVIKVIFYVITSVVIVAVRLLFRSIKSIFLGLLNVFAGTKNFITITAKGQGWWRWLIFIIKLPIVFVFNIVKWVLTSTLGTLYNFFESIFMVVKYWIEFSKKNGQVGVRKLYEFNLVKNNFQQKTAEIGVLKGFIFAEIDIDNTLTGSASETKNRGFIKAIKNFFVSIGDTFLFFGISLKRKKDSILEYNTDLVNTLGISTNETPLLDEFKIMEPVNPNDNIVLPNDSANKFTRTNLSNGNNMQNINANKKLKTQAEDKIRIPLSSVFGGLWEIL